MDTIENGFEEISLKISSVKESQNLLNLIKKNLACASLSGNQEHLFPMESFRQALLDNYLMITDIYKLIIADFE